MTETMLGAEALTDSRFHHAEGPVWDWRGQRLLCVDLLAGDLVTFSNLSEATNARCEITHVDDTLAFIRRRSVGGWIAGSADSLLLLDENFVVHERHNIFSDGRIRFNDGGCDADGVLYAGTMAYDESPGAGSLYRFGPNGQSEVVLPGVTISNGIAQLPGGAKMYYIDSPTQRVDLLSFEGAVAKREPFVTIPPEVGTPDGMTVDTQGGAWVALWGGGRVQRFDPAGNLTHEVAIPTPQVTACTFGGANGSTLFVTTSQIGSPSGDQFAGAVFAIDTDFEGREEVCLS